MTAPNLFRILGDIDEALIAEAAPTAVTAHKMPLRRWIATAACLLLSVGIGLAVWYATAPSSPSSPLVTAPTGTWPTVVINTNTPNREPSIVVVPPWNEMTITQQFPEVIYAEQPYRVSENILTAAQIGAAVATVNAQGYDLYTKTSYTTTATLYTINGVAAHCAVAVQYDGADDYYSAVNSRYRPDTLGDLIEDTALEQHLSFGTAYYNYVDRNGVYHSVRFDDLADQSVWELLLADRTLNNVYDQQAMYAEVMSVSVDIPLLGYQNIGLWVTEEGYLVTNILDTGKAFYIGTDKVNAFMNYVFTHGNGIDYVYQSNSVGDGTIINNGAEATVIHTKVSAVYPTEPAPYAPTESEVVITEPTSPTTAAGAYTPPTDPTGTRATATRTTSSTAVPEHPPAYPDIGVVIEN